jgi:pyridoxal phosphate enzyme (YggS family)
MSPIEYLTRNINQIRQKIEAAALVSGRKASEITLVAVTKKVDYDVAKACYDVGLKDLGENRVQELQRKLPHIPEANWHLIGRLQTNKVKDIVGKVSLIHSLDRWNLAEEINKRYQQAGLIAPVLLQVNISGEQQKAGVDPREVNSFLDSIGQLTAIRVQGLMTIAPEVDNAEETRPIFRELYQMKKAIGNKFEHVRMDFLSMGMSQDYEIAIQEGSNMVRIGSAIFKEVI